MPDAVLEHLQRIPLETKLNLAAIAKLKVGIHHQWGAGSCVEYLNARFPFRCHPDRCSLTGLQVANCVFVPHPKDLDCLDSMLPRLPFQEARTLTMKYTHTLVF